MFTKEKNKRVLKTYFLIVNLILATVAISFLIGDVDAECANGQCSVTNTPLATAGGLDPYSMGGNSASGQSYNPYSMGGTAAAGQSATAGPGSAGTDAAGNFGSGATPFNFGEGNSGAAATGNAVPAGGSSTGATMGGRTGGAGGEGLPNGGGSGEVPKEIYGGATQAPYQNPAAGTGQKGYFDNLVSNIGGLTAGAGIGALIGQWAGGKNGAMWGGIAGMAGVLAYQISSQVLKLPAVASGLIGIAVFALIFILTYKKETKEIIEFQCNPWQSPIGGEDCEKCNTYGGECGEYTCKSLGQACDLVNKGEKNQNCVWKNPRDTNSPTIEMINVTKGHHFILDKTIRPPATGVEILIDGGKCIKAFTPLAFTFKTNEPSQCKIDYNLTTDSKTAFDSMGYYVGGDSSYGYNHSEKLALPGPEAVNKVDPTLQNDGTYTLYVRCQDANGNYNVNPFSVRFCVDPGPDTTPPMIVNVSIPGKMPIQFNRTNLSLEVYINEPADCKWSHENRDYDSMEENMSCDNNLWEMNNEETYTCVAKLTGIEDRKENIFYFRCMDKPDYDISERNVNKDSYKYIIYGTQPLNILKIEPNETIAGATDLINLTLYVRTDNGYKNGEARCYFSRTGTETDYIEFSETGSYQHSQRQDLIPGIYKYYIKCIDLGGNAAYNETSFTIENDKISPGVIRIYKDAGELKIITNENADCAYSNINCNFEIDDGLKMSSSDYINHNSEWKTTLNYYIRCKDKYNNQPNPNVCTIIVRPTQFAEAMNLTIEL